MEKSFTERRGVQGDAEAQMVTVQMPLPLLATMADVQEGFLALCVRSGRAVLAQMMEHDRTALCGPKGVANCERTAGRAGSVPGEITLGGRRIPMRRLRVRSVKKQEVSLPSFVWAASRDPLNTHTLSAIASGVSTRKYARNLEALPDDEPQRAVSKSAVSRRFVALSVEGMTAWLSRPLGELNVRVVMIDGIGFADHCVVIALGISEDGRKHVLGLREGATENTRVAQDLITDLQERGLATDRALLFVIDGSKALRKAIRKSFGELALIQRCQVHKGRNVLDYLPKTMHGGVRRAMNEAYASADAELAKRRLERLARALESDHPSAAASLHEGLEETLTLQRLGIGGTLYRTLRSTNPIENLNGSVAHYTRNVKRWRGGQMLLRWVAAALREAHGRFRRVRGHKEMLRLLAALAKHERELQAANSKMDTKRKAA